MAGVNNQAIVIGEEPQETAEIVPLGMQAIESVFAELGSEGLMPDEYERLQRMQAEKHYAKGEWFENLVDKLSDSEQGQIAAEVVRWTQFDEQSRAPWAARERRGIELLGVVDLDTEKEPGDEEKPNCREGLSKVTHPGLAEAGIQFYSRAIVEMWPPEGPVKTRVMGKPTEALKQQAERVEQFMNDLYTRRMPGGYEEEANMLMRLPFAGSTFKKVYFDPLENCVMSVFVEPADFLVPFAATNLRNAPRYTHRLWESGYIVQRKMDEGFYAKLKLTTPTEARYPKTRKEIDEIDGKTYSMVIEDRRHEVLECHPYLDIPSLRNQGGKGKGSESKLPLPWVVTVDRDTQKILSLRRNWKKNDEKACKRIPCAVHFKFLPGFGFYGWGWFHWLGGLSETETAAVRALLDSASYENFQGGFKTKWGRVPGGTLSPLPGEWLDVEASYDELSKGFFPLPRHPPSDTLFKLLGYMDELSRRVSSTTEALVGDANTNGPVGTILALIDQGMKPAMAIHSGLHRAKADEFAILSDQLAEHLPPRFTYATPGEDREILASDFDERVDVIPVSDPRMVTNTQRIAQNQSILQLAQQFPNLYDAEEANRRMLESIRVQDIDGLLKTDKPERMDAVQENMAMLTGKPVKSFPDQLHPAHIAVHQAWFQGLAPPFQQQLQGIFMAHLAEHMAWDYRNGLEQKMGIGMPFPTVMQPEKSEEEREEMPPGVDDTISMATAQFVQALSEQQQAAQAQATQEQEAGQTQALQAEQGRRDLAMEAEEGRKDRAFQRNQARRDEEARRQAERESSIEQARRQEQARNDLAERIRQEEEKYRGLE